MAPVTVAKIALAVSGVLVFGYGLRVDAPVIRWIGIGLVAVAAAMRFLDRRPPPPMPPIDE